jgi:D-tyrosyl-tRNA(Tyr) deacylase
MRATVQRVSEASVTVEGRVVGAIRQGLLVYVGVAVDDGPADVQYMLDKISNVRIFNDEAGKMNRSVLDVAGGVLVISAFALQGDARKGRRPSFDAAARPELAQQLYDQLCAELARLNLDVQRGVFRAHMDVASINDGPITVLLDSKRLF